MTTSTTAAPDAATAKAHGRFIRGSVSKVRRVLDQIRGRTYRDALIMLEFMIGVSLIRSVVVPIATR